MWGLPLFPPQASTLAPQVDALFFFMLGVSAFFSLLIAGLIVYFAIKYHRRSEDEETEQVHEPMALELTWTMVPLALTMVMYAWGASVFFTAVRPPRDALEVYVVGKQWMWKFQHAEGQREIDELHVPLGRPVRPTMTSEDVIHSFFVPAFRVKQDVLPGRYTTTWFNATRQGTYHLFCAEYCGTQHSGMIGQVVVMEPTQYEMWLGAGAVGGSLSSAGEKLFQDLACNSCHTGDAQARGPNLQGLFGRSVALEGGGTTVADESYIRESVLDPRAKIAAGYQPIMPTYEGLVTEEQLLALVAYLKSLARPTP